jgi:hypothetical protein
MASIVVRQQRTYEDRDPAETWAKIADLSRFGEWFPVRQATSMTGAVPQVGNIIFVFIGRARDPEHAIRLEVVEWEAGRRFVCETRQIPGVEGGHFTVEVDGTPLGGTTVKLGFVGESTGLAAQVSGYEINRRMRRALERLAA